MLCIKNDNWKKPNQETWYQVVLKKKRSTISISCKVVITKHRRSGADVLPFVALLTTDEYWKKTSRHAILTAHASQVLPKQDCRYTQWS